MPCTGKVLEAALRQHPTLHPPVRPASCLRAEHTHARRGAYDDLHLVHDKENKTQRVCMRLFHYDW
jgi:hypothetical protein